MYGPPASLLRHRTAQLSAAGGRCVLLGVLVADRARQKMRCGIEVEEGKEATRSR